MKVLRAKSSWFKDRDVRLDASFHLSDGRITKVKLDKCPYSISRLEDITNGIFNGARFKRYYVEDFDKGIPFMGSSDMLKANLNGLKLLSKKLSKNLSDLFIKKNWILVSCSGTIGNTVFTNDDFAGKTASQHIMRIVPNEDEIKPGYLYSYLSSKYGYALLTQGTYGAVIQHIEPQHIVDLPIPMLPQPKQQEIHSLIESASDLRVEANKLLIKSQFILKENAVLKDLSNEDYEYFGTHSADRNISFFKRNIREISALSINAFNYSKRIESLENKVKNGNWKSLVDCLDENCFFSTGSFKRLELDSSTAIKLINQSDIFDIKKQGKKIAKSFVKADNLVEYGEVLIAGVGTLGENETFCRAIFANEELEGQLIAGEFIRMKTNNEIPSGYLYCWLSTDYGFRFIRRTQTGTKLCRPIQELLKRIPVPILDDELMLEIDIAVKQAHTWQYEALNKEIQAISIVEKEIESWQES